MCWLADIGRNVFFVLWQQNYYLVLKHLWGVCCFRGGSWGTQHHSRERCLSLPLFVFCFSFVCHFLSFCIHQFCSIRAESVVLEPGSWGHSRPLQRGESPHNYSRGYYQYSWLIWLCTVFVRKQNLECLIVVWKTHWDRLEWWAMIGRLSSSWKMASNSFQLSPDRTFGHFQ